MPGLSTRSLSKIPITTQRENSNIAMFLILFQVIFFGGLWEVGSYMSLGTFLIP